MSKDADFIGIVFQQSNRGHHTSLPVLLTVSYFEHMPYSCCLINTCNSLGLRECLPNDISIGSSVFARPTTSVAVVRICAIGAMRANKVVADDVIS